MPELTVTIACRWRPAWRWYLGLIAARLHLHRLVLHLVDGVVLEMRIENRPWEAIGNIRWVR